MYWGKLDSFFPFRVIESKFFSILNQSFREFKGGEFDFFLEMNIQDNRNEDFQLPKILNFFRLNRKGIEFNARVRS